MNINEKIIGKINDKRNLKSIVTQSILTLAAIFPCSTSFAQTSSALQCPVGLLKTSKDFPENLMSEAKIVNIDSEKGDFSFENDGKKMELSLRAWNDELVTDIYQIIGVAFVDGKREGSHQILLKYSGISEGSGWDLGPAGSKQYKILAVNSLDEAGLNIVLTDNAFSILKKFGQITKTESNFSYLTNRIKQAIESGDLKENETIGTVLYFGCWSLKEN